MHGKHRFFITCEFGKYITVRILADGDRYLDGLFEPVILFELCEG